MKRLLSASLILSVFALGGCASGSADSDMAGQSQSSAPQSSVLSKLRPKASPNMVRAVQEEENRKREEQIAQAQAAMQAQEEGNKNFFQTTLDGVGSMLPKVSTEPISYSKTASLAEASSLPVLNPFESPQETTTTMDPSAAVDTSTLTPADDVMPAADPSNQQVATYSLHYNPAGIATPAPGAIAGGNMVPPPPQISLSTDASMYPPPPPNAMPYNPYAQPYNPYQQNPYYNQSLNPYGVIPPQSQQPVKDPEPKRPAGLFGVSKGNVNRSDAEPRSRAREEEDSSDFVPIRPTGMQARSPYKQRDDLKVLWDGALASDAFHEVLAEDDKLESILRRVPVGMPPDSSKGMFTVPQRRVETIFRPVRLNKKVSGRVAKLQKDLVHSYYRYMHTYNKYALAQQTMQARKQQIEVARSRSEKQRAAADLAAAESQAQAAKEDMRAAQYELAAIAGARSARSVIGRISGVTPTVGALADAEKSTRPIEIEPEDKGVFGSVGKLFSFGSKGSKKKDPPKAEKKKVAKNSDTGFLFARKSKDLKPKPEKTKVASKAALPVAKVKSKPASPISFELKKVNITARKSILSVAIRNTGSKEFKVAPNDVSISEGTRKISKETLRAKFDSNVVKPNQEVKGKITIYGRPWNDRLAVYISDGSSKIQLNRRN